jgi:GTP-binding protein HflX
VFSDTVGFIRDLPAELLSAFRATLEELRDASLLLHVLDASDPTVVQQKAAVEEVLRDMKLSDLPLLVVLNKCDLLEPEVREARVREFNGIEVSALKREGLDKLVAAVALELSHRERQWAGLNK